jgi:hypothetical protein
MARTIVAVVSIVLVALILVGGLRTAIDASSPSPSLLNCSEDYDAARHKCVPYPDSVMFPTPPRSP